MGSFFGAKMPSGCPVETRSPVPWCEGMQAISSLAEGLSAPFLPRHAGKGNLVTCVTVIVAGQGRGRGDFAPWCGCYRGSLPLTRGICGVMLASQAVFKGVRGFSPSARFASRSRGHMAGRDRWRDYRRFPSLSGSGLKAEIEIGAGSPSPKTQSNLRETNTNLVEQQPHPR